MFLTCAFAEISGGGGNRRDSAINELITNAVKHGFAGRREGSIVVSLQEGAGKVLVQVRDDGVGLPEGFDPSRDARLGLRIVQGIVEQDLGGEFTRRYQDQCARLMRFVARLDDGRQALQQRQRKAGGLAGPGLRRGEHVAALENDRDGLLLNRGGV